LTTWQPLEDINMHLWQPVVSKVVLRVVP